MKKILFGLLLALQAFVCAEASAAACTSGSLATYQSLGAAGCTIGKLSFSNFGLLSQPTGAIAFPAILVNPVTSGTQVGFEFVVNGVAPTSTLLENLIAYRVTGVAATVTSAAISFLNPVVTGDGADTVVQNLCAGGLFAGADGVSGCTGTSLNQILLAIDGFTDSPMSLALGPAAFLAVVTDIAVDGGPVGTAGAASLTSATNLFGSVAIRVVPEPAPLLLMATGLIVLIGRRSSRRSRVAMSTRPY